MVPVSSIDEMTTLPCDPIKTDLNDCKDIIVQEVSIQAHPSMPAAER